MKRGLCVMLAALVAWGACGCGGTGEGGETTPTTVPWEAEAPQMTDISDLVTSDEVSNAVGTTVGEGVLHENGSILAFSSEDYTTQVSLLVEKPEEEIAAYFAAQIAGYAGGTLTDAPNLGDEAYWCAQTNELLLRSGDYALSVYVVRPDMSAENALIAARQLAALAVERLS